MHLARARLSRILETFWVLPAATIVAALSLGIALPSVDRNVTLPEGLAVAGDEDTARTVLTVVATMGVSVAGVSFSVIVVALVLASQQLSPRVLRSFQTQPINQAVLALLLGTATYALFVLAAIADDDDHPVPEMSVTVAMALAAASLGLFVVFLHHAVRSLNASAVIRRIAAAGHEAVEAPYPEGVGEEPEDEMAAELAAEHWRPAGASVDVRAPRAGYVASVDGARIVAWASSHDAFVEQRRPIGAFAVTGALVAEVYWDGERDLDVAEVQAAFVFEEERLVDGDVAFPIRQLADVALKGLSPGINDPTTAENAMDSVTDTLVRFAHRGSPCAIRVDAEGRPRLRAVSPTLDDLVRLGFDQVRRDAANRPSFATRLLELLADLRDAAPATRECEEIARQARLIRDQAAQDAEHHDDQGMVCATYDRLHGTDARQRVER